MIETFLVFEQFLTKTLFPNFCGGVYIGARPFVSTRIQERKKKVKREKAKG